MSQVLKTAWQPLTPQGVARFARASVGRLLFVQAVFALAAAAAMTWCIHEAWFPIIRSAIERLPEQGEIRSGCMEWPEHSPQTLAEGNFLSLGVDLTHSGVLRGPAHVQVEFGQNFLRLVSLFGHVDLPYPSGWSFGLSRSVAEPWWGAWSPVILAVVFVGTCVALLAFWALLATVCCLPVWLIGFSTRRALELGGAWRLCGASPLLGALFLSAALVFYGMGLLDPVRLLIVFGVQLLAAWVYQGLGLLALPRIEIAVPPGANPFASTSQPGEAQRQKPRAKNPFGQTEP